MKYRTPILVGGGVAAVAVAFLVGNGCTGDSVEGGVRLVGLSVEGFYAHPESGNAMVRRTTGADVESLNLMQHGDYLEAFDNNGVVFSGTIGKVTDTNLATFTLEGQSTAGQPATISGTISVQGSDATMRGSWIEPTLLSEVYAVATVPTNAPPPVTTNTTVELNPTLVAVNPVGGITSFTASGGTGSFTWRVSNSSLGNFLEISGSRNSTASYGASGVGNNTVTVTDVTGKSATATVQQSADGGGEIDPVSLNQSLVTVDPDGGTADFAASGGTGEFSWSVGDSSVGIISSISGSRNGNATYSAVTGVTGQNLVTVRDGGGDSTSATVVQADLDGGGTFPPIPN